MQSLSDRHLLLAATDLSNFLACNQLSLLDRAVAFGEIGKPPKFDDPGLEALRQRGREHEARYLESLREHGRTVLEIPKEGPAANGENRWRSAAAATIDAMRAGADVIYQGCLFDGTWLGLPDFLQRVERPSDLGAWSYEVADAKLAREAKGGALLQVLLYADLLAAVQGTPSEHVYLALGGPEAKTESFRVDDFSAYFRSIRRRFTATLDGALPPLPEAPEPVEHCQVCNWKMRCDGERRRVDHLSLVAGIRRVERRALVERGVASVESLARLQLPVVPRLDGVSDATLERTHEQARVQVEGRQQGRPVHELLPVEPEQGLAMLPEPSPGDLFFDLEGDPYALTDGIEYLFGFVDRDAKPTSWWALDRASEKAVFERFIDFVMARLEQFPGLHVYHYAPYEPTAIKRLMGRHATREDEVDRLLRGKVFVDLYRAVRQGVRASVESYSIKKLEPFYGYTRDIDLRSASNALANFEAWLQLGGSAAKQDDALLSAIQGYNLDDCVSTLRLAEWLETLRTELEHTTGEPVPRPAPPDPKTPDGVLDELDEVGQLVALLEAGVPADTAARTPDQHARWLLAQLLGYHRREAKSTWWEYFRRMALSDDELIEDGATMGGLSYERIVDTVKRSVIYQYRFPTQDHEIRTGVDVRDPKTGKAPGTIVHFDEASGTIHLRRGLSNPAPHPRALVPFEFVRDDVMRESLRSIARNVLTHGFGESNPDSSAVELLLGHAPRAGQSDRTSLVLPGETTLDTARRVVNLLDRSVLPIQGPPGAGKSYTAARMILSAIKTGKRVGVTATSHKVISNLLEKTCRAATEEGIAIIGLQKADTGDKCPTPDIEATDDYDHIRQSLDDRTANIAAGTAWLWSRDNMRHAVDVLFIDEAGQFSLANALAVAPSATNVVLVGDPQQLQQPQQGVHPPGVEVSALDHLLAGAITVSPDRGLFLDRTWRLHPDICAFTSKLFYENRLESHTGLERQAIRSREPLNGSGLRLVLVDHVGRQSECPEEAETVMQLVGMALDGGTWVDEKGEIAPLQPRDIKVVAPYNAHVAALKERVPPGVEVGTVDRFQGQEAPLVIYSMASSSAEDSPRGMDFLYNPNRLNVATSRAKCMAVVVASPRLFAPECRTPAQMRLANAFCALEEFAGEPR